MVFVQLQEVHHKKNGIEENDPTKPSNDPSQGYDTDDHKVPLDILLKRYGTNVTRVNYFQVAYYFFNGPWT